ncbi:head GIN domain-containing protein [Tenacibaculum maritimum]|uniref:head GIN domain-containing protein n=1 Tax=Tenacibaculum maritimum TaxID=107401 RepID=UPI0023072E53|nr:head GIN domain-containing protein [Tenacibaculum maritimum]MDB0600099.1 DUF2807 domain-containing protein [Tenacibaculum maritimum]MDB0600257.1 DUF2807 domain-containing protein [Tenacibaculum maritimum]MDB0610768.1 DUF2807 domain-containing protein [Tenacibaculum maritimum]
MKNISKTFILLILAITLSSCLFNNIKGISGNRNVIEQQREVKGNYSSIAISNGLNVYITQGKESNIKIEADENLHNVIKTEIQNKVLKIYAEKNIKSAKSKDIYISTPSIKSITTSSGSYVITENTLTANTFTIQTSSGSYVKLRVKTNILSSSSSSGSNLNIIGETDQYTGNASSGSTTNAYDLTSKVAIIKTSSGASIQVFTTNEINAKASSGSSVSYKGNPKRVFKKSSSGGNIHAY